MTVRGAPLIGAAGAFGIYLATLEINFPDKYPGTPVQCCKISDFMPSYSSKSFLGCKLCNGKT